MHRVLCSLLAVGSLAGVAAAQNNLVYNGGFEELDGSAAVGWQFFNTARVRADGDGLGDALVRTGLYSLEFPSGADFAGATTNIFNPDTLEFYDPPYVWRGGPARVSGWYAIPADQPLVDANSGLKLEFRRANSSIYLAFEDLSIDGHTDGEWRQFSFIVGCDEMTDEFPPFAESVSVLPIRFGSSDSTGTIFWDDLSFTQCLADMNCDDIVNTQDFIAFLNLWTARDPRGDFDNNGTINTQDFIAFLNTWTQPCP